MNDLNLFFPTPVWASVISNHDEVNKRMYDYISNLRKNNPNGISKSNNLGWHSENFDLKNSEVTFFVKSIGYNLNKAIKDMGWDSEKNEIKISAMWSIVNGKNASNSRHIHSNNFISAAYYVRAPEECGDIVFYDPRDAKVIRKPMTSTSNKLNTEVVNISPKEGLLVLFPSYLHHSVNQNNSTDERMVISFNVNLIY